MDDMDLIQILGSEVVPPLPRTSLRSPGGRVGCINPLQSFMVGVQSHSIIE